MAPKQCLVIMPIGDQVVDGKTITMAELRKRYDDLIKEAIKIADPELEVTRADDVAMPGTITSDILTRIMHSPIVIGDVTFPNPNVFYELGLRHACRLGTVIIRDKEGPRLPFDIAHQRAVEYSNTPSGLKELGEKLKQVFGHFSRNPTVADNHLQELAQLTKYRFPDYSDKTEVEDPETVLFMEVMQTPSLMKLFIEAGEGAKPDPATLVAAIVENPKLAPLFAKMLVKSGSFSLTPNKQLPPAPPQRKSRKRRR
ncbi:MAG: hypothetical protein PWP23_312 [Candidatus Sumerlaeota bacterium]|nr:hypothetical protein [Candidatus Sumerlaeota bacterium]